MILNEYLAKAKVLGPAGVHLLEGALCETPDEAAAVVRRLGRSVVKAQVPMGKRGKAGGIRFVASPEEASAAATDILKMTIAGHAVSAVLVERAAAVVREFYAAVLHEPRERASLVLFAADGGMEVEEITATKPHMLRRHVVRTPGGFDQKAARAMLFGLDLGGAEAQAADVLVSLYKRYRETDAELLEINPLALLADGRLAALDCKFILDDAAAYRQPDLAASAAAEQRTVLEARAHEAGLKFIELDGSVGILANGAGLTMTTMDVVQHYGGRPANFLEIGGEAYTRAEIALGIVLANPKIKSLVVNFCGAFARTDVMAKGVVEAWKKLKPDIPVFFSVHGTGEDKAVALIRQELEAKPFDLMEDAVRAAIGAAQ